MRISQKIAMLLFYSTLLISIIISAIFMFIVYKLEESSLEAIINYRLTLILILFLLISVNIGIYLFVNENIIKRFKLIEKSIKKLIMSADKNNNFKNDEISKLDDEINIVLNKLVHTEMYLQQEEKNYTNILNAMSNSFFHLKAIENNEGEYIDGIIIDVNFAGAELLGLTQEEVINNKLSDIYINFSRYRNQILEILTRIKDSKSECIAQEINIVDDKWGVVSVYSLNKGYFSIIVNDVTEIKKYAEDMTYLANYDTLTN
ncbi:PAS domain S-box protein [Clostridium tertium]|uniref:PAS domain S-box protein n=1 Tax=Clostridium tertium TaxID=1559 RepID=UPI0024B37F8F|nr:PAS domain S-box protein [Clostridium tertium]MDI9218716.1 PAS domain S-box protein [Clostridium tertium]